MNTNTHTNGTSSHMNGTSHTSNDSDTDGEMSTDKKPAFVKRNHTVASLKQIAQAAEKGARRAAQELKRKEKMVARIEAARMKDKEVSQKLHDLDTHISYTFGSRYVPNR